MPHLTHSKLWSNILQNGVAEAITVRHHWLHVVYAVIVIAVTVAKVTETTVCHRDENSKVEQYITHKIQLKVA